MINHCAPDSPWPDTSCAKSRAAYYQAGHAVVALHESLEVACVWLDDDAFDPMEVQHSYLSQLRLSGSIEARSDVEGVIRALLAGPAALLRYSFGIYSLDSPAPKFNLADRFLIRHEAVWRAVSLAATFYEDSPSIIHGAWQQVNHLVQDNETWSAIDAVANGILMNGELAGCEIADVSRHAMNLRGRRS